MPRRKTTEDTGAVAVEETAAPKRASRSKTKVLDQEPATPREVREYLLANSAALPEGVTVGTRGRLSTAAREHFTTATGRSIVE